MRSAPKAADAGVRTSPGYVFKADADTLGKSTTSTPSTCCTPDRQAPDPNIGRGRDRRRMRLRQPTRRRLPGNACREELRPNSARHLDGGTEHRAPGSLGIGIGIGPMAAPDVSGLRRPFRRATGITPPERRSRFDIAAPVGHQEDLSTGQPARVRSTPSRLLVTWNSRKRAANFELSKVLSSR